MRILAITETLRAAAKEVMRAYSAVDWDDIAEIGADVVFLEFSDADDAMSGERLFREIIAHSDLGAVDDVVRNPHDIVETFIAPLSAFLKLPNHKSKDSKFSARLLEKFHQRFELLSNHLDKAKRNFGRLLDRLENHCLRGNWSKFASTWQQVTDLLVKLDLLRREAANLRADCLHLEIGTQEAFPSRDCEPAASPGSSAARPNADIGPVRRLSDIPPPSWLTRSLLVGPVQRDGKSIKVPTETFTAGAVIRICADVSSLNISAATFPMNLEHLSQVLRCERLFQKSGLLRFQFADDSPFIIGFQDKAERLIQAQLRSLSELSRNQGDVAQQTVAVQPSRFSVEIRKPTHVIIRSDTRAFPNPGVTARRVIIALFLLAGGNLRGSFSFRTTELIQQFFLGLTPRRFPVSGVAAVRR